MENKINDSRVSHDEHKSIKSESFSHR